jgi:ADP-dependent phosphofructokinase/glucokinase
MGSPTQRSLEYLRKRYPLADVVERRVHRFVTRDFVGIIDIIALSETEIVAVQTTSGSNLAARITKMAESDALPILLSAGIKVFAHGWSKRANGRWHLREVELS